jgi:hypothetical protein
VFGINQTSGGGDVGSILGPTNTILTHAANILQKQSIKRIGCCIDIVLRAYWQVSSELGMFRQQLFRRKAKGELKTLHTISMCTCSTCACAHLSPVPAALQDAESSQQQYLPYELLFDIFSYLEGVSDILTLYLCSKWFVLSQKSTYITPLG